MTKILLFEILTLLILEQNRLILLPLQKTRYILAMFEDTDRAYDGADKNQIERLSESYREGRKNDERAYR